MAILKIQGEREIREGVWYEVDSDLPPLGYGGMGAVFRGTRIDRFGNRHAVAVKFLYEDLPDSAIERARREARIQIHNENLIEMYGFIEMEDVEEESGKPCKRYHIVSEFLDGVNLFRLLKGDCRNKDGKEIGYAKELYQLYVEDRVRFSYLIIKNLLSGIMALHDKGYIHRDIDPSNIMVTSNGNIKLIDFGIAKSIDNIHPVHEPKLTSMGQTLGKPGYSAPELVEGDLIHEDQTTDLYSVGVILYELVTGHLPFSGSAAEIYTQQCTSVVPVSEIRDRYLSNVILKATSKIRSERFQSAAEFRAAIEQLENRTSKLSKESGTFSMYGRNVVSDGGNCINEIGTAFGQKDYIHEESVERDSINYNEREITIHKTDAVKATHHVRTGDDSDNFSIGNAKELTPIASVISVLAGLIIGGIAALILYLQ